MKSIWQETTVLRLTKSLEESVSQSSCKPSTVTKLITGDEVLKWEVCSLNSTITILISNPAALLYPSLVILLKGLLSLAHYLAYVTRLSLFT